MLAHVAALIVIGAAALEHLMLIVRDTPLPFVSAADYALLQNFIPSPTPPLLAITPTPPSSSADASSSNQASFSSSPSSSSPFLFPLPPIPTSFSLVLSNLLLAETTIAWLAVALTESGRLAPTSLAFTRSALLLLAALSSYFGAGFVLPLTWFAAMVAQARGHAHGDHHYRLPRLQHWNSHRHHPPRHQTTTTHSSTDAPATPGLPRRPPGFLKQSTVAAARVVAATAAVCLAVLQLCAAATAWLRHAAAGGADGLFSATATAAGASAAADAMRAGACPSPSTAAAAGACRPTAGSRFGAGFGGDVWPAGAGTGTTAAAVAADVEWVGALAALALRWYLVPAVAAFVALENLVFEHFDMHPALRPQVKVSAGDGGEDGDDDDDDDDNNNNDNNNDREAAAGDQLAVGGVAGRSKDELAPGGKSPLSTLSASFAARRQYFWLAQWLAVIHVLTLASGFLVPGWLSTVDASSEWILERVTATDVASLVASFAVLAHAEGLPGGHGWIAATLFCGGAAIFGPGAAVLVWAGVRQMEFD